MGCASGKSITDNSNNPFANISDKKVTIHTSLTKVHSITNLHNSDVFSFTLLPSKETIFIIGYRDGTLILLIPNLSKKTHELLVKKQSAHLNGISYIQPLSQPNLFSTSSLDKSIKLWQYSSSSLTLLHSIDNAHEGMVNKLILSQFKYIISCSSEDSFVHIWNSSSPYNLVNTITAKNSVWCIIALVKHDGILIGSCYGEQRLCFWKLDTCELVGKVNGIGCYSLNGMIELVNGDVVCINEKGVINVINVERYEIVKEINGEGWVNGYGSLCLIDEYSFGYCCKGKFCQVEFEGYEVVYKGEYKEEEFDGDAAMLLFVKGKCFVCENHFNGLSFMEY